ncbi:MAG TPA: alpha/beta hydrolase [Acidimicrobiales bacterium]|nr:alpha/beta hydrolase [Acidimicrobiales bacterium]
MATTVTPDGNTIAFTDHGGSGPDLLLAHATGFCGGVWAPIADALTAGFRVVTFDERGHGASEPAPNGEYNWEGFATDALAVVDALDLQRPFGAGHSCGGALLVLAELRRPGTFRSIWAFEPIIFPVDEPIDVQPTPNGNRLSDGARRRRAVFASREEARANYASKPPLMWLDPRCLDGYVACGFVDEPDGSVRLACDPENEARTYEMGGRHGAYSRLHDVGCQVTLVCGETTDAIGPAALPLLAARLPHATVDIWTEHGHFGCLADPERTIDSIRAAFNGS